MNKSASYAQHYRLCSRSPGIFHQTVSVLTLAGLLMLVPFTPTLAGVIDADGTNCSLENAILSANTDTDTGGCTITGSVGGADTINLNGASYSYTSAYANPIANAGTALPFITSEITIEGNGSIIERSGGDDFGLIQVRPGGNLTLNDLTVRGGQRLDTNIPGSGGGIFVDANGGQVTLTLNRVTLRDNRAIAGGGLSVVAQQGSGESLATVTINHSTILDNRAETDPNGFSRGGGVELRPLDQDTVNVTINNSTIVGNHADHEGGGLINQSQFQTSSTLTVNNSTLSDNSAGGGAAIYNGALGNGSVTTILRQVTVTANTSSFGGGGISTEEFGGGLAATTLSNSVVAGNTADVVDPDVRIEGTGTSLTLEGVNLIGADTDSGETPGLPNGNGHFIGTVAVPLNALLQPLADNGGGSQTHALRYGSLAIYTADDSICLNPPIDGVDQRGVARLAGSCDIGAFEMNPVHYYQRVDTPKTWEQARTDAEGMSFLSEAGHLVSMCPYDELAQPEKKVLFY